MIKKSINTEVGILHPLIYKVNQIRIITQIITIHNYIHRFQSGLDTQYLVYFCTKLLLMRLNIHSFYTFWVGFIVMWFTTASSAQNNLTDLKQSLASAQADSTRSRLLCEIGIAFAPIEPDSALVYLNQSLQLAEKNQLMHQAALTMYELGKTYWYQLKYEEKGLEWIRKSIKLAESINDNGVLALDYRDLGILVGRPPDSDIQEVHDLFLKAVSYAQKANDQKHVLDFYNNIAYWNQARLRYPIAETYYLKLLKMPSSYSPQSWLEGCLDYCNLLEKQGRHNEVKPYCQQALQVLSQDSAASKTSSYLINRISVEGRLERYAEAEATLNTLVAQEKAKVFPDTIAYVEAYKAYMNICVRRGDYKSAYEAAHKFFTFRTALRERRVVQSIKVEAVKYKAAYEREKREQEIKYQRRLWLAGIIILVLVFSFTSYYQYSQRRLLKQEKELAEAREALKTQALAEAEEELSHKEVALIESTKLLELKNTLIAEMESRLAQAQSDADETVLRQLKILTQDDWLRFRELFDAQFPQFISKIKKQLPKLTTGEMRLILLIKTGFDNSEIANVLGISMHGVYTSRHRLRQKLGLSEAEDLEMFIQGF